MGFIISTIHDVVLIVNPMGIILVRWKSLRNNLEILCHPICTRLYLPFIIHASSGNPPFVYFCCGKSLLVDFCGFFQKQTVCDDIICDKAMFVESKDSKMVLSRAFSKESDEPL